MGQFQGKVFWHMIGGDGHQAVEGLPAMMALPAPQGTPLRCRGGGGGAWVGPDRQSPIDGRDQGDVRLVDLPGGLLGVVLVTVLRHAAVVVVSGIFLLTAAAGSGEHHHDDEQQSANSTQRDDYDEGEIQWGLAGASGVERGEDVHILL